MLSKTVDSAIKALIFMTLNHSDQPVSPKLVAERISSSPTYLAKVMNYLVKADILRSHRGVQGGVSLSKAPSEITLLSIIEACKGKMQWNYCNGDGDTTSACGYHQAMYEAQGALTGVYARWPLADIAARPRRHGESGASPKCVMNVYDVFFTSMDGTFGSPDGYIIDGKTHYK